MIIAIEGIDGAGKQTLAELVVATLDDDKTPVTSVAFPRYDVKPFGPAIGSALESESSVLRSSVEAMAVSYAADRWHFWTNFSAKDSILVIDRWSASNAAYGAARIALAGGDPDPFVAWIATFEFGDLDLPKPDLTVLLATDSAVAGSARGTRDREDSYETDTDLQSLALDAYFELAEAKWGGQWLLLDPLDGKGVRKTAAELAGELTSSDEFANSTSRIA